MDKPVSFPVDRNRVVVATPFDWKANDYPEYGVPGEGCRHGPDHYAFACPGCGRFGAIRCGHPKPDNGNGATWDVAGGSLDDVTTLTLSPSINCVGCCSWHGWLRNGTFAP